MTFLIYLFLFLNILISFKNCIINKGDDSFDMEDMIDDFITFFIAGQETTAGTLACCMIELARNPLVLQK